MLVDTVASLGQIYRARSHKDTLGKKSAGSGDVCSKIVEKEVRDYSLSDNTDLSSWSYKVCPL